MKRFPFLLLLVPLFAAVACLSDAEAPSNDPAVPEVRYDSETLTRVSLTIAGTFPDDALSMDYGFELAENSFAGGPDQVFAQPGKDAEGLVTCVADIRPGAVYVVRSYFSNGQYRKSSQPLTITAPLTSAATLTEVTNANGRLSASIRDDGGRPVREAGFCWAEVPDPKTIRKHRIPATVENDGSFSLELAAFEAGTYYILAYAENASTSGQVFGYSRTPLQIVVSDEIPVTIPDPEFSRYLTQNFDTNRDGVLSLKEVPAITSIDVNTDNISSLEGIEMMPDLVWVGCRGTSPGSGKLTSLDLSHNPKITTLYCENNQLDALDVSSLPDLQTLSCPGNKLTAVDVSANPDLTWLDVSYNGLTSLDVSDLFRLVYLNCSYNALATLDVSGNPYLQTLLCTGNRLSGLDVTLNQDLTVLHCPDNRLSDLALWNERLDTLWCFNNQLTGLDISHSQRIRDLRCDNVRIPDANFKKSVCADFDANGDGEISIVEAPVIDRIEVSTENISSVAGIEYFQNLWYLACYGTPNVPGRLTSLNLSKNPKLRYLDCSCNRLTSLNVNALTSLEKLNCRWNQLTALTISRNTNLTSLNCSDNRLTNLDVSRNTKLTELYCTSNQMTVLDVSRNTRLTELQCDLVPISDAVFRQYLADHFDTNGDGSISIAEVLDIRQIEVVTRSITSLDGIAYFPNLTRLVCDGYGDPDDPSYWNYDDIEQPSEGYGRVSGRLLSLDVSQNTRLTELIITDNPLTTLDVSNNPALVLLDCSGDFYLEEIWLKTGQTIATFYYGDRTSIFYK